MLFWLVCYLSDEQCTRREIDSNAFCGIDSHCISNLLWWQLELQFEDRSAQYVVSPLHAAIIMQFEDQPKYFLYLYPSICATSPIHLWWDVCF
jgi:hypothetical protein